MNQEQVACDFCDEFTGRQSLFHSLFRKYGITTRVVTTSKHSIAIAGLGALSPGYLLVLPIRHVPAVGYLTDEEIADLIVLKEELGKRIRAKFGALYGDTVFFEHGASSTGVRAGQSIDHAHMHALPGANIEFRKRLDRDFTPQPVDKPVRFARLSQAKIKDISSLRTHQDTSTHTRSTMK